jgi:phage shock protein E
MREVDMRKLILAVLAVISVACSPVDKPKPATASPAAPSAVEQAIQEGALIVDVRTPEEYASGHYPGAVNIPVDEIERRMNELGPDKNRPIVLYCRSGRRSGIALDLVRRAGYTRAVNGINQASLLCPTGRC